MKFAQLGMAAAMCCAAASASAQVAMSGNFSAGFQSGANGGGAEHSAWSMDRSSLDVGASYDLGSGAKIEGKLGLGGSPRGGYPGGVLFGGSADIEGREASVAYSNDAFGEIKLGVEKSAPYFHEVAQMGLGVAKWDGLLHEMRSDSAFASFTTMVGPAYVSFLHAQKRAGWGYGGDPASEPASEYDQNHDQISVYREAGDLKLLGTYRWYGNQMKAVYFADGTTVDPVALAAMKKDVVNLQASYDWGLFSTGVGYQVARGVDKGAVADMEVVVKVPMGKWELGASIASSTARDFPDTSLTGWDVRGYEGTSVGTSLVAKYAIQKNISLSFSHSEWTYSGYAQYEHDARNAGLVASGQGSQVYGSAGLSAGRARMESLVLEYKF